jgi:hypothetical protein
MMAEEEESKCFIVKHGLLPKSLHIRDKSFDSKNLYIGRIRPCDPHEPKLPSKLSLKIGDSFFKEHFQ